MEHAICKIIQHLDRRLPQLSTIDEDYGQLEAIDNDDENRYPLTFPAVLIAEDSTQWTNIEPHNQKGLCTLTVRLIIDCYDDTHAGAPLAMDATTRRMELQSRLHRALQGYRPLDDGPLVRTMSRNYTFRYGIKVYETTYTFTVTDLTLPRKVQKPKVSLHVARI